MPNKTFNVASKGLSESEISRVKGITTGYDILACKAVFLGLEHTGLAHLASASTFIPTASVAYLAASAVKNPIMVARESAKAVGSTVKDIGKDIANIFRSPKKAMAGSGIEEAVGLLCDAAKEHAGDDWFFAILPHAIEVAGEHGADISGAIRLAEEVEKRNPPPKDKQALAKSFVAGFSVKAEMEARDSSGRWTAGGGAGAAEFAGDANRDAAKATVDKIHEKVNSGAVSDAHDAVDEAIDEHPDGPQKDYLEAHSQRLHDAVDRASDDEGNLKDKIDTHDIFSEDDEGTKVIPAKAAAAFTEDINARYGALVTSAENTAKSAEKINGEIKDACDDLPKAIQANYDAGVKSESEKLAKANPDWDKDDVAGSIDREAIAKKAASDAVDALPHGAGAMLNKDSIAGDVDHDDGSYSGDAYSDHEEQLAAHAVSRSVAANVPAKSQGYFNAYIAPKMTEGLRFGSLETKGPEALQGAAEQAAQDMTFSAIDRMGDSAGKGRLKQEKQNVVDALASDGKIDKNFFDKGHH